MAKLQGVIFCSVCGSFHSKQKGMCTRTSRIVFCEVCRSSHGEREMCPRSYPRWQEADDRLSCPHCKGYHDVGDKCHAYKKSMDPYRVAGRPSLRRTPMGELPPSPSIPGDPMCKRCGVYHPAHTRCYRHMSPYAPRQMGQYRDSRPGEYIAEVASYNDQRLTAKSQALRSIAEKAAKCGVKVGIVDKCGKTTILEPEDQVKYIYQVVIVDPKTNAVIFNGVETGDGEESVRIETVGNLIADKTLTPAEAGKVVIKLAGLGTYKEVE